MIFYSPSWYITISFKSWKLFKSLADKERLLQAAIYTIIIFKISLYNILCLTIIKTYYFPTALTGNNKLQYFWFGIFIAIGLVINVNYNLLLVAIDCYGNQRFSTNKILRVGMYLKNIIFWGDFFEKAKLHGLIWPISKNISISDPLLTNLLHLILIIIIVIKNYWVLIMYFIRI